MKVHGPLTHSGHGLGNWNWLAGLAVLLVAGVARAQLPSQINIDRPGDRQFIVDHANLINAADKQKILAIADKLLSDKAVPIVVVTIESMAQYGGAGLRIETFSRLLFDQWGIGPEKVAGQSWNYGILLIVSRDDRRARIELGAGWRRDKDQVAQSIMDNQILPKFKTGDFSGGITSGVSALDHLARDLQLPSQPISQTQILWSLVMAGLLIFTVVSLVRKGSRGWAWLMWSVVFSIIGTILYAFLVRGHSRYGRSGFSSGSFGGGSFGGGFSGGGGASGSW